MRYAHYLGSVLSKGADKLIDRRHEVLTLRDELAVSHMLCAEAARVWSKTMTDLPDELKPEQKLAIQQAAAVNLEHWLNHVRDMTMAAHRVEISGAQIDVSLVHGLLAQVANIAAEELEVLDGPTVSQTLELIGVSGGDIADRLAERLRRELMTVDALSSKGTSLKPESIEDQVMAMDAATCPAPPPQLKAS